MKGAPRPLKAFKKENKEIYNYITTKLITEVGSKKTNENNFYYWFAIQRLMKHDKNLSTPPKTNEIFFFKNREIAINKGAIIELGRLLVLGWYYNLEDYAKELCLLIIKQYLENKKGKIKTDRLNLIEIINHIKINIIYFSNNKLETIQLINTIQINKII